MSQIPERTVSEMDKDFFVRLRDDVTDFMKRSGKNYDKKGIRVLDIAPQDHAGAVPYFLEAKVETLDIDPQSNATYIADLCEDNSKIIDDNLFDVIVCTEVLEHTLQPFKAVDEIHRLLKRSGVGLISTPFNFRIHGPLPDCWRFTEHGLRALFDNERFEIVQLDALEEDNRFLMPIHYTMIVKKR